MAMNSYILDDYIRGVTIKGSALAKKNGLKQKLEKSTGISFSTYLSDRKAAYRLKMKIRDWVIENCQSYFDGFPYNDANMTKDDLIRLTTNGIYWNAICDEYGKDTAIAIKNKILQDFSIRDEFFAEGDKASSRDFSYILDRIQNNI